MQDGVHSFRFRKPKEPRLKNISTTAVAPESGNVSATSPGASGADPPDRSEEPNPPDGAPLKVNLQSQLDDPGGRGLGDGSKLGAPEYSYRIGERQEIHIIEQIKDLGSKL